MPERKPTRNELKLIADWEWDMKYPKGIIPWVLSFHANDVLIQHRDRIKGFGLEDTKEVKKLDMKLLDLIWWKYPGIVKYKPNSRQEKPLEQWWWYLDQIDNRTYPADLLPKYLLKAYQEAPPLQPVNQGTPPNPFDGLTSNEVNNKLSGCLGYQWAGMSAKPSDKEIERSGQKGLHIQEMFQKHQESVGVYTLDEYHSLAYDIIKKPEKVSLEIGKDGSLLMVFIRGNLIVVCQYDNYSVMTLYKMS